MKEGETRFKEDPIWILLHGVRHNNHAERGCTSSVGWLCCRVVVRKLVSGSPVADVISPCPASRSRSSQVSHTVRLRRLEREKEGENKLYACVTFGVARFVKKGEWWGREGGPAPGPRGHRRAVCPRCVARARADYASPFTVHQHLRLLRANTPTGIIPIVRALSPPTLSPYSPRNNHAVQHTRTHTPLCPPCNEFLSRKRLRPNFTVQYPNPSVVQNSM